MWSAAYEECAAGRVHRHRARIRHPAAERGGRTRCAPTSGWRTTPRPPAAQRDAIKRQVRDAFYTDTDAWKQRIVEQGLQAARQAVAGLGG